MSAESVFTRTDTPEGARFDVTPAAAYKPAALGCLQLIGFVGIAVPCLLLLAGLAFGNFRILVVGLVLGTIVWFKGGRELVRGKGRRAPKRETVSLLVNAEGIRTGGKLIAAEDIAELTLRHPADRGGISPGVVVREGVNGAAYNRGLRAGTEMINRSYALMARRRSVSTPEILAFGLTWHTGEALLNDVSAAMNGELQQGISQ